MNMVARSVAVLIQQILTLLWILEYDVMSLLLSPAAEIGSREPQTADAFEQSSHLKLDLYATRLTAYILCSFSVFPWQCDSTTNRPGRGTTATSAAIRTKSFFFLIVVLFLKP